jgi:serine/threonine protein kinase
VDKLASGTLLGHYKLVRRLGQGGMGVVWEAADQKLGRHVAIKLLIEATSDSRAALDRIWREARAASSLNHPGICTIYELNETADSPFIVMELLAGSSLDKLSRGHAMPYPKLVELGVQLADALDAAHHKGIVHRDIKPGNIFLTNFGQAKFLDFGLAKLNYAGADASTALLPLTDSGWAMGTVAYMSPEQARGEPLDTRSDLFSLGVVLYEMATGQHPFSGATTAVIFDRILNHAPVSPISLNPQLPVELEIALNKTLEKDRELRCQSAADIRADLKRLQRKSSSGSTPTAPSSGVSSSQASSSSAALLAARKSRGLAVILAFLVVLAVAGFAAWRFWSRARPFADVSINQVTNVGTIELLTLSADGRFLAEVKNDRGQRTLWVRNTTTNTDTQILGAFGNRYIGLTFSPDGNYLYFVRGTPENDVESALYVMPVFGGTPRQLIADLDSTVSFSPDGKRFTYVRWTPDRRDQNSEVHVADKDGSHNQVVYAALEDAGPPVWSPDGGRIAWIGTVRPTAKYALQMLDLSSKKLTIAPIPADVTLEATYTNYTNLAWTPDGRHLVTFYLKPHTGHAQIGIVTVPSGEFHAVTNDVNSYSQLALSADGRTLATVLTNIGSRIAWYKPQGGAPVATTPLRITPARIAWANEDRLLFNVSRIAIGWIDRASGNPQAFDPGEIDPEDYISACSDGHILFTGFPKGEAEARVFRMDADGGNIVELTASGIAGSPQCSADSQQVYYSVGKAGAFIVSLWAIPLSGGTPRQVLPPETTGEFAISPDGKLASYETVVAPGGVRSKVIDIASGQVLSELILDNSDAGSESGGFMRFSPDNRAIVYSVLRSDGGTLLYQPLDGSTPHPLIDPVQEDIKDFGWSLSGKQLAVVRVTSSSDVVLISDRPGNSQ